MKYDPLDPKNLAFYLTYMVDEKANACRPGGSSTALVLFVILMVAGLVFAMGH